MKRKTLIVVGILSLLVSCQNELPIDLAQPEITQIVEKQEEFVPSGGMIQLGRKLENPYSLENMRRAFDLLPAESRGGFSAEDIQPTHLYVKFKPKNVDELDAMLWSDSTLHFYDYPLDYEQISGGCHYHDPSLPEGVPTYYYVSIPVGHPIPEVCEYEILEELYIPDELTDYTRTLSPSFINAIVKKSFELTGNEYECDAVATRSDGQTRASYTFWGKIRVYDSFVGGYVPVPGARIKCKRWFTTVSAYTDANGEYSVVRESLNRYTYYIYWERDNKYDIRDGELDQAITDGPETSGGWSLDITNSSLKDRNFATINRAAYRYFYGNRGGLDRLEPHSTGNLKICYKHESSDDGHYGLFSGFTSFGITGDIWIWGKTKEGVWRDTNEIFATSCHEMGHANHYNSHTSLDFATMDNFIVESWARFVQSLLSYVEYGELSLYNMNTFTYEDFCIVNGGLCGIAATLSWPDISNKEYSCFFIDLYDSYNQWVAGKLYPNDNISGYSAATLNTIINDSQDMSEILSHLKSQKPIGVTNAMIDDFVNYYLAYK